jgi:hypothetical protein
MMASKIKRMNIKEFRDKGFLQEANRLFFHPLGLAIEIVTKWPKDTTDEEKKKYKKSINHPNAKYSMGGVWDYRDDSEGMLFANNMIDKKKVATVEKLRTSKLPVRLKLDDCNEHGIQV